MGDKKIYAGGEFLITDVAPEDVFTPEDFTEEHKMILDTGMEFVKNEVIPNLEKIEEKDHDVILSLHRKAGELGLLGTEIPEEYGGLSMDKVSTTAVGEAMGPASSFAVVFGAHSGIGTLLPQPPHTNESCGTESETYSVLLICRNPPGAVASAMMKGFCPREKVIPSGA